MISSTTTSNSSTVTSFTQPTAYTEAQTLFIGAFDRPANYTGYEWAGNVITNYGADNLNNIFTQAFEAKYGTIGPIGLTLAQVDDIFNNLLGRDAKTPGIAWLQNVYLSTGSLIHVIDAVYDAVVYEGPSSQDYQLLTNRIEASDNFTKIYAATNGAGYSATVAAAYVNQVTTAFVLSGNTANDLASPSTFVSTYSSSTASNATTSGSGSGSGSGTYVYTVTKSLTSGTTLTGTATINELIIKPSTSSNFPTSSGGYIDSFGAGTISGFQVLGINDASPIGNQYDIKALGTELGSFNNTIDLQNIAGTDTFKNIANSSTFQFDNTITGIVNNKTVSYYGNINFVFTGSSGATDTAKILFNNTTAYSPYASSLSFSDSAATPNGIGTINISDNYSNSTQTLTDTIATINDNSLSMLNLNSAQNYMQIGTINDSKSTSLEIIASGTPKELLIGGLTWPTTTGSGLLINASSLIINNNATSNLGLQVSNVADNSLSNLTLEGSGNTTIGTISDTLGATLTINLSGSGSYLLGSTSIGNGKGLSSSASSLAINDTSTNTNQTVFQSIIDKPLKTLTFSGTHSIDIQYLNIEEFQNASTPIIQSSLAVNSTNTGALTLGSVTNPVSISNFKQTSFNLSSNSNTNLSITTLANANQTNTFSLSKNGSNALNLKSQINTTTSTGQTSYNSISNNINVTGSSNSKLTLTDNNGSEIIKTSGASSFSVSIPPAFVDNTVTMESSNIDLSHYTSITDTNSSSVSYLWPDLNIKFSNTINAANSSINTVDIFALSAADTSLQTALNDAISHISAQGSSFAEFFIPNTSTAKTDFGTLAGSAILVDYGSSSTSSFVLGKDAFVVLPSTSANNGYVASTPDIIINSSANNADIIDNNLTSLTINGSSGVTINNLNDAGLGGTSGLTVSLAIVDDGSQANSITTLNIGNSEVNSSSGDSLALSGTNANAFTITTLNDHSQDFTITDNGLNLNITNFNDNQLAGLTLAGTKSITITNLTDTSTLFASDNITIINNGSGVNSITGTLTMGNSQYNSDKLALSGTNANPFNINTLNDSTDNFSINNSSSANLNVTYYTNDNLTSLTLGGNHLAVINNLDDISSTSGNYLTITNNASSGAGSDSIGTLTLGNIAGALYKLTFQGSDAAPFIITTLNEQANSSFTLQNSSSAHVNVNAISNVNLTQLNLTGNQNITIGSLGNSTGGLNITDTNSNPVNITLNSHTSTSTSNYDTISVAANNGAVTSLMINAIITGVAANDQIAFSSDSSPLTLGNLITVNSSIATTVATTVLSGATDHEIIPFTYNDGGTNDVYLIEINNTTTPGTYSNADTIIELVGTSSGQHTINNTLTASNHVVIAS